VGAPPGIPAEAAKILRAAFAATVKDPGFIAEMERGHHDLSPENDVAMEKMLEEVSAVPSDTLTKLIEYTRRSEGSGK
jgi:tripartite-type tricarboxylate transporter receptor subunit TctC